MVNGDGGFLMALFLRFIFIFMNKAQIRRENAWMDRTGGGEYGTQRIKTK